MKIFLTWFGILFSLSIFVTSCSKDEPGDEPEDFFSMKSTIKTPVPSFNLNDFNIKPDDGFLLAGSVNDYSAYENRGVVINLKPDGKTIYASDFAIESFIYTIANHAVQKNDGLTFVTGICFDDWRLENRFVATLDQNGKLLDHRILSVPGNHQSLSSRIIPRSDGNFYLVSRFYPYEWEAPHLFEVDLLDSDGNLIWDKKIEGVEINADQVTLSSSDGLIIPGYAKPGIYDGSSDFLFILTDKDGNEILHKVFGTYVNWEEGNYCIEENGKGFLFSGTILQSSACTIFRISSEGEVNEPVYVERYKNYTSRNYILKTRAPGYMVMSYTNSYFVFTRLNEDFSVKWSTSQVIRSPSQGNGTWSSCHFVPAGNGKFAFAYVSDDNILLFRTRSF